MAVDHKKVDHVTTSLQKDTKDNAKFKEAFVTNPPKELAARGLNLDEVISFYDKKGLEGIIGQDC